MKVKVSGNYHGQAPYEMHSIDIELADADFAYDPKFATLSVGKRIDRMMEVAGIRCVAFALRAGLIPKEEGMKHVAGLKAKVEED